MDIIKQISILLWVLGAILIAPPILRHFDIDVKQTYAKILAVDTQKKDALAEPALRKKDISPEVFEELFKEHQEENVDKKQIEKEFKELISGLERVEKIMHEEKAPLVGVPAPFRSAAKAESKVRWLPPPEGFSTGETFHYLIYRENSSVGEKLKSVLDNIHANLMLDLTPFTLIAKPNKILVMLFGNRKTYMSFTKRPAWSGAASDLRSDTMYIIEGRNFYPLSVHELTHLYFDGYFSPAISPLWLSEGMAVYMQIYATRQKPSWIDRNIENILQGGYIPLEEMVWVEDLSHLTTRQAELWYTQAYSVVDYLLNERTRDEFYRFCNELKMGTPVYQALYRAYGMPFTKVSVLQNVWLHDLAKHSQGHMFMSAQPKRLPVEVISSTQTVSVRKAAPAAPKPAPKTVIPTLEKVPTNGFRGGF